MLVLAAVGMVLAAAYFLRVLRRVGQGPAPSERLDDVAADEWLAWTPLVAFTVVLGVAPVLLFDLTEPAVRGRGRVVGRCLAMTIQSIDLLALSAPIVVAMGGLLGLGVELVTRKGQLAVGVGVAAVVAAVPLAFAADGRRTLCDGDGVCAFVSSPLTVVAAADRPGGDGCGASDGLRRRH